MTSKEIFRKALIEISQDIYCLGPGCIYCERDDNKHPPSRCACIAKAALETVDKLGMKRYIVWNPRTEEYDRVESLERPKHGYDAEDMNTPHPVCDIDDYFWLVGK